MSWPKHYSVWFLKFRNPNWSALLWDYCIHIYPFTPVFDGRVWARPWKQLFKISFSHINSRIQNWMAGKIFLEKRHQRGWQTTLRQSKNFRIHDLSIVLCGFGSDLKVKKFYWNRFAWSICTYMHFLLTTLSWLSFILCYISYLSIYF